MEKFIEKNEMLKVGFEALYNGTEKTKKEIASFKHIYSRAFEGMKDKWFKLNPNKKMEEQFKNYTLADWIKYVDSKSI